MTNPDDLSAQDQSASAATDHLAWPEDEETPDTNALHTHNASGLTPAQDERILEDVDPQALPATDAWGRREE